MGCRSSQTQGLLIGKPEQLRQDLPQRRPLGANRPPEGLEDQDARICLHRCCELPKLVRFTRIPRTSRHIFKTSSSRRSSYRRRTSHRPPWRPRTSIRLQPIQANPQQWTASPERAKAGCPCVLLCRESLVLSIGARTKSPLELSPGHVPAFYDERHISTAAGVQSPRA